ncbi:MULTISPECIES: FecR family protein [Sphingobacterium]|uniref:FecR family protein n=1 Tax=Sphingobacterium TaxID=28453 RepID=UPI00257D2DA7|nr:MULTISPECIES: FecR family protein [Sphingobacterium]
MKTKKEKIKHIFDIVPEDCLTEDDKAQLFQRIVHSTNNSRRKRWFAYVGSIAAAACLLICFKLFSPSNTNADTELDIGKIAAISQTFIKNNDSLQLISIDPAAENHAISFLKVNDRPDILNLLTPNNAGETVRYNTVFVPYGRRQEFTLPDQSKVWLNAGSYLTYNPDMQNKPREVYLNGEGYFDVAHTGTTFIVKTKNAAVKVLGTTFNVSSYEEDKRMSIELITGKVELSSPHFDHITMTPGQFIAYDLQQNKMLIDNSGDGNEILWTKKQLVLDRLSTKELIRKLERIYNVKIHTDQTVLEKTTIYSGRINLDVNILTSLSNIYELRDYTITQLEKEVWIKSN